MLNFICTSVATCLQSYLGAGYIALQTPTLIIYINDWSPYTYICNRQQDILMCERKFKNEY